MAQSGFTINIRFHDVAPEGPWLAGMTTCEHCGHVEMSVRPVGTQRMECSECGEFSEDPAARDMIEARNAER